MAEKKRDEHVVAVEVVYSALKELSDDARKKVLASVLALLGESKEIQLLEPAARIPQGGGGKPVGLNEIVNDKKPGTNAQYIAIFAYHREKTEGLARFNREALRSYFAKAKLPPPSNFDRDFVEAVKKGWIHEDGDDSYLTTKGIEAVESGFEGQRKYSRSSSRAPRKLRTGSKKKAPTKRRK